MSKKISKEDKIALELLRNKKPMTKEQLSDATGLRICVIDTVLKKSSRFTAIQIDGSKKWTLKWKGIYKKIMSAEMIAQLSGMTVDSVNEIIKKNPEQFPKSSVDGQDYYSTKG